MSNPSPKNSLPDLVSNLLLFFGVPAALSTIVYVSTKNMVWTIIICSACAIFFYLMDIPKQIAQNVKGRLINNATESVMLLLKQLLSNPEGKYYEHLSNSIKELDMKGLTTVGSFSLLLKDVFVDLEVLPTLPHSASANPVKSLKEARSPEGKKSIWDYLSPHSAEKRHLVILGSPGSGKTTLLRHVAMNLIPNSSKKPLIRLLKTIKITIIPTSKNRTPILLYLRENVRFLIKNPEASLFEVVCDDFKRKNMPIPLEWMERKLEKGQCIILLDGLDEVADVAQRHRVVDWVQIQMNAYHQNLFLITSRPYGYKSYPLTEVGIIVLEVQNFTKDKVKQFVHRWYNANEASNAQLNKKDSTSIQAALAGANDLLQRMINKPALFDLAVNPLLLTMITTVHRYRNNSLPIQRIGLYREICEVFLGRRQEMRGIDLELTADAKRLVLQRLAFVMISTKKRGISLEETEIAIVDTLSLVAPSMQPQKFLKLVENSSGLLLEKEAGIYEFAHLTFQEYLASTYIKEEQLEQLLLENINISWWHETIRLYCAQMKDASNIIISCIESVQPSINTLVLAIECVNEAGGVQLSVRKQLDTFINQSIEHSSSDQRHLIAEIFLTQRTQQMAPLEKEIYIDKTFITCAEYQLFIDDQQKNGIYYNPDHWDSNFFPVNHGKLPVMGIRSSDAKVFCAWLSKRSPSGIWQYRLPTTEDLKKLTDDASIHTTLGTGTTYWIEDNGKTVAANKPQIYTATVKQNYFDPKHLYTILPFLELIVTLPRKCATILSPEEAHNYVAILHPIIQLAHTFAKESGVPDWIIAYFSSLTPEKAPLSSLPSTVKKMSPKGSNSSLNVAFPMLDSDLYYSSNRQGENFLPDLPPNPSTAFNNINVFLKEIVGPNRYIGSFLNAVNIHMEQNGLTLDPELDQVLFTGHSSLFKVTQTVKSILAVSMKNMDQIKNALIEIDKFTETSFYTGESLHPGEPLHPEESLHPEEPLHPRKSAHSRKSAHPEEPVHSEKPDPKEPVHSEKPDPKKPVHSKKPDPKKPVHSKKPDPKKISNPKKSVYAEEMFYMTNSTAKSYDARTIFIQAQKHLNSIDFSTLNVQLHCLANQLITVKSAHAFNLDDSIPQILQILDGFNLETLLNIHTIVNINQTLLDALDLSRQRAFNSLYIDNNVLPAGSILVFLHLLLRVLTIRLFAYLQNLLKIMSVMHKNLLLFDTETYAKSKRILNEAINQCISIYATSTIIGARHQGQLPVLEGILLIKEPQK